MRRIFAFHLSLVLSIVEAVSLIALPSAFARAQTAAHAYAEIASIDTQGFPQITALVNVYDANSRFMDGLKSADLTAYEDSQPR